MKIPLQSNVRWFFLIIFLIYSLSLCADESNGKSTVADSLFRQGEKALAKKDYSSAIRDYFAALSLYESSNDKKGELKVYFDLLTLNYYLQNYPRAIESIRKGIELSKQLNDSVMLGRFLTEYGATLRRVNDYTASWDNLQRALFIFKKLGMRYYESNVYNHIGSYYLDLQNYDKALEYYKTSLDLLNVNDTSYTSITGTVYTRMAHIYFSKEDYVSSLLYNKLALESRRKCHQKEMITSSMFNIAHDFLKLDNPDSAFKYLTPAIESARVEKQHLLLENGYKLLYEYYDGKKNYGQALFYYKLYNEEADTNYIQKSQNDLAVDYANRQIDRIMQNNELLESGNTFQSLNLRFQKYTLLALKWLLGISGFIFLFIILAYFHNRSVRKSVKRINERLVTEDQERIKAEAQIKLREEQYHFIADNSLSFITRISNKKMRIYASPASLNIYGWKPEEMLDLGPYELTHPDYVKYAEEGFAEMVIKKQPLKLTYLARHKTGRYFWVESLVNPIFNETTGEFIEFVGVTRNIDDKIRKEMELQEGTRQKENLITEIHHRVKNNFAILVSLISIQKDQTSDENVLKSLTNLQMRIKAMSLVHEMLYRSGDFEKISMRDYLQSIVFSISNNLTNSGIDCKVETDEIFFDLDTAIPLGLIVNELIANAYKHAFPDDRQGEISLLLTKGKKHKSDGEEVHDYQVIISDNGVGVPEGFHSEESSNMGFQIVHILVQQLEAKMEVNNHKGFTVKISFRR